MSRGTRDDETISFLPLNHVYEQIYDLMVHLTIGHIINFTENTDTVMADMRDVSPTLFHAVPRIWEKYYSGIVLKMADATWFKKIVYKTALKIGGRYNDAKLAGRSPSRSAEPCLSAGLLCRLPETQGTAGIRPGHRSDFPAPPRSPTTS